MRFRTRLLVTMTGTILLSSVLLAWIVRENMTTRFTAQYDERGSALATTVASRFNAMSTDIDARLDILQESVTNNEELRSALSALDGGLPIIDPVLTEFGILRARMSGLDVIQLQGAGGLVLTSSHNPKEHGRQESALFSIDEAVFTYPRPILRVTRFPDGTRPTLVRLRKFLVDGKEYFFTAGVAVDDLLWKQLTPAPDFELCLQNSTYDSLQCKALDEFQQAETGIYHIDLLTLNGETGNTGSTAIIIRQSRRVLTQLLAEIDQWLLIVFGVILGIGMLSMVWVSGKISNPLSDLLYKTSRIDLNRLNVNFKSGRKDEIGDLARVLDEMTRRLRISRSVLRDSERKLAIGEVARQVNHDIKNGLTPIRNIIQHFSTAARENDPELSSIVVEREASLKASIQFLEDLAGNYARLSPHTVRTDVELNSLLSELIEDYARARSVSIPFDAGASAQVSIDKLAFRRVLENLLDNGFDSISGEGAVRVQSDLVRSDRFTPDPEGNYVKVCIVDTGAGMNPDELENAVKDFHTTKTNGTGLGLSIVRRLVMDMNASMSIESVRGKGTTVTLLIPLTVPA